MKRHTQKEGCCLSWVTNNCPVLTSVIIVGDQELLGASHQDLTSELTRRSRGYWRDQSDQLGGGEPLSLNTGRDCYWEITGALSLPLCHDLCHVSRGGGVCSSWHCHHHRYITGCLLTITTVTVTRLSRLENFPPLLPVTWDFCN